ncbi:MAG: hypothetical protein KatS3mg064_0601 [Tepidiforma sp.]|nr:DnaJ domain-containing protein [Tepidiforma sp.]GIW17444.1 MAG: hypothetical protein KatS3mg064_0601 [Tepidiforma sp.]
MAEYKPWRYAPRDAVLKRRLERFREEADIFRSERSWERFGSPEAEGAPRERAPRYLGQGRIEALLGGAQGVPGASPGGAPAAAEEKKGGKGLLGKLGDLAGDVLDPVGDVAGKAVGTALKVLDAPREYVGSPLFAIASGQTEAERKPVLDAEGKPTGQYYREKPGFGEMFRAWGAALQDPVGQFKEGREAFKERAANPEQTWLSRAALNVGSDPLSLVGPRAAARVVGAVGLQGTKAGRVLYEVLDSGGGGVVLGANAASEAQAEYGDQVPLWNRLSPEARAIIAGVAGGVAGGAIHRRVATRGLEGIPGAKQGFGLGVEDVSGGRPTMREGFETLRHADITERPDLFQGRDADPGKTYSERKVGEIVENFDPMRLEPGLVVRDAATGQTVVVRGHHRLEAMKRLAEQGKVGETGTWQVVDADLSNPAHVQELRRMAMLSNYSTSGTNLREDLRAVRVLLDDGEDVPAIAKAMRVSQQEAEDLVHLSRMPQDLVDRVVETRAATGNAAEVARAAKVYGLTETDVRAMFGRYVFGDQSEISRTRLRERLTQAGRMLQEERAKASQAGFGDLLGDDSWRSVQSDVLDVVDRLEAKRTELESQRRTLVTLRNSMGKAFGDDPRARELSDLLEERVARLEDEIAAITGEYEARAKARFAGDTGRPAEGADRGVEGAAGPDGRDGGAGPLPGQQGLFGDEVAPSRAEAEPQQGRPVEQQPPTPEEPGPVGEPGVRPQDAGPRPIGRADVEFSAQGTYRKTRFITLRSKVDGGKVFIQVKLERWPESPEWRVRLRTGTDQGTGAEVWETVSTHASLAEAKKAALDLVENDPRAVSDYRPRPEAPKEAPAPRVEETVKEADLFGNVRDTFRTEGETAGIRETQGDLLGRLDAEEKLRRAEARGEAPAARPGEAAPRVDEAAGEGPKAEAPRVEEATRAAAPGAERAVAEARVEADGRAGDAGRADEGTAKEETPRQRQNRTDEPFSRDEARADEAEFETPKADEGPPPPLDRSSDWAMLGLEPGKAYTKEELKRAYRRQARRYHPDINSSPTAMQDMKDINAAFERLAAGRGQYHARKDAGAGRGARAEGQQGAGPEWAKREQAKADEQARSWRKAEENPPPGGGPHGPSTEDWYYAYGTTPPKGGAGAGGGGGSAGGDGNPGGPRFRHFGQDERFDLFNAKSRDAQVRAQQEYLQSLRGRLNQMLRRVLAKLGAEHYDRNIVLDTLVRPFVVGEKNRVDNLIQHWVSWFREEAETRLKRAGITVERAGDGSWRIDGDPLMPTIEDVIERSTPAGKAYWDSLTAEQRQALEFIEWGNEAVNKTILAHGGKVPWDPDIEGTYFPRKVIGIDGQERTSGASDFRKSRTMESLEEGLGRDVEYTNPFDALEAGMRGKLRHAQDAYLREVLEPLAVKPNAKGGIRAGFGYDYVDHPAVRGLLFRQGDADRIRDALKPAADNIFTKIPKALNAVLTPLRATGDLSATLQQGMIMWIKNPKAAADYWTATVMSLKNPEYYFRAIDRLEGKGPGLNQHIRWGARYVDPHSADEYLMPKVAKRLTGGKLDEIPVVGTVARKSNEHFARFLNLVRFELGNQEYQRAVARGLTGEALDDHMRQAWNAINRATGWSGRKVTTMEQVVMFAPRYFSSSAEQLYAGLTRGGIEGSIARQHLARQLVMAGTVAWLWNTAHGYETDWDPRSGNWLRLRNVAGMDVSLLGTYDTLYRGIAGTLAGKPGQGIAPDMTRPVRFMESKLSPAAKIVYEPFVKRETYLGEPLDPGSVKGLGKIAVEQAKSSLPFGVQSLIEEGPGAAVVSSTGVSASLLTVTERLTQTRDDVALERFGKRYDELRGAEKSLVNEDERVAKAQAAKDAQDVRRGGDAAALVRIRQTFKERMAASARYLAEGKDDAGKPFTGNDYRDAYHELQTYLAGQRDLLKDRSGGDAEVDGWFRLYDEATMANGQLNFDRLDALQAAYREKHPGIDEKVDRVIGVQDDQTLREFREAQKLAKEYYQIPAYRGMSLEDAQRASEVLQVAQGLVRAGQARDTNRALAMMTASDPEGVVLARRALRRGANPARRRFRLEHPEFGRFYTNAAAIG